MASSKKKVTRKTAKKIVKRPALKKREPLPVTREFLLSVADNIYNPTTKKFLRLCNGKLQNGPDPVDKKRPMHCGIGEIYFAMSGIQPNARFSVHGGDSTDEAIEEIVRNSVVFTGVKNELIRVKTFIGKARLDVCTRDAMLEQLPDDDDEMYLFDDESVQLFKSALDDVPVENDDCGPTDDVCTVKDYEARAKQVASQIRKAAKLLPKTV